jgi:hypothetical protein
VTILSFRQFFKSSLITRFFCFFFIFRLFRFASKQFCLFGLFRNGPETPKQTETNRNKPKKLVFGFTKQTENQPKQTEFRFEPKFFFICFEDTLVSTETIGVKFRTKQSAAYVSCTWRVERQKFMTQQTGDLPM